MTNELRTLSPKEYDWQYGTLPRVEDVPYDCRIILWSESYIGLVLPHGNKLNPLRWCNDSYHPSWGKESPQGWWTWLYKGKEQRPPEVKTWAEMFETPEKLALEKHLEECEHCREYLAIVARACQ